MSRRLTHLEKICAQNFGGTRLSLAREEGELQLQNRQEVGYGGKLRGEKSLFWFSDYVLFTTHYTLDMFHYFRDMRIQLIYMINLVKIIF